MTMHDARTNLSGQVIKEARSHFPLQMLSSVIPRSVRLSQAPSYGLPGESRLASRGALAYAALAEELLARGSGDGWVGGCPWVCVPEVFHHSTPCPCGAPPAGENGALWRWC